jgi:hypothetical protein
VRSCMVVGTVSNFVCGWAVEHYAAMALMKRSPKITANWAFAMVHSHTKLLTVPGSLLGITWHWLQHRKLRRTVAGLRSLSYAIAASNRSSGTLANVVKLSAIA